MEPEDRAVHRCGHHDQPIAAPDVRQLVGEDGAEFPIVPAWPVGGEQDGWLFRTDGDGDGDGVRRAQLRQGPRHRMRGGEVLQRVHRALVANRVALKQKPARLPEANEKPGEKSECDC